ncbi:MAG TPA: ABC transporter substrate-binding protein [Albitalea sp.]|nr:ABC transporter substrate-binding protein [Albitalea sp.]
MSHRPSTAPVASHERAARTKVEIEEAGGVASAHVSRRQCLAAAAGGLFAMRARAQPNEIVIGQSTPLTGVLATSGAQIRDGIKLCFDQVNASGGVHGARIRHVVRDDGYKVEETMRQTQALIDKDRAVALIGYAGTANVAELLKQGTLAQAGIAMVGPVTGAQALRTPFNPNVFHVRAGYADEMEHMVNHLYTIGIRRIGVFYQNDGFGQAGLAGAEQAAAKRGLKLAVTAGYERNTMDLDVSKAVSAIRANEPQALIMVAINKPAAAFAKAYRLAGGSAQLLNISVVDAGELIKLAGLDTVQGLGITQVMPFPYTPGLPVVREYQALLAQAGEPQAEPSYFSLESFIGAKVLVEGLRRAGPNPTPEKVMRALEGIDAYDTGGFAVRYGRRNRVGSRFVDITIIGRNGKLLR